MHIPDTDQHGNLHAATKGDSMTHERLFNFSNQVIIQHTDGTPAALFTIIPIPPNTTAWLLPYNVLVFGSAKQMVRHQHKLDRQSDISPTLVSNSAVKRTWDRPRTYTPQQL